MATDPQKRPGSVYQLSPEFSKNRAFAACMFVLTEDKGNYAMGYVQGLGETRSKMGGQYYIFAPYEEMEYVGQCTWMIA